MKASRWLIVGFVLCTSSQSGLAQEKLSRMQMEEDLKQLFTVTRRAYAYVEEKKEPYGEGFDCDRKRACSEND